MQVRSSACTSAQRLRACLHQERRELWSPFFALGGGLPGTAASADGGGAEGNERGVIGVGPSWAQRRALRALSRLTAELRQRGACLATRRRTRTTMTMMTATTTTSTGAHSRAMEPRARLVPLPKAG